MLEIVDEVDVLNNEVNYVIELYEYVDKNNIFIVDNKNVILDYSLIEIKVAF